MPKAVERLADDWERLVTFYQCPREHWLHIRTTNIVESPFATVRLRTTAAKRFKKVENAAALIWKILQVAESTFRRLKGAELLPAVYARAQYKDGVQRTASTRQKMVVEAETDGGIRRAMPLPLEIPSTLQDALMARLDRLGTAKEVAQQGAVLGRELTYELLSAVSPLTEAALQQELTKLVEAELLYQRGRPPQATYLFKHALVQETAYQSLLKSKR